MNIASTQWRKVQHAVSGLIDLMLPLHCAGCGTTGTSWCPECAMEIGGVRRVWRPLLEAQPPAYALGRYRGAARRAVLAYKEAGRRDLAEPLGCAVAHGIRVLATEFGELDRSEWALVPAPSRTLASRRRGGAHMLRIGRHAASSMIGSGWSAAVADCLALRLGARDSVGLGPTERAGNLARHLVLRPEHVPASGTAVILIDDVITTGATSAACLRALESVGVRVVATLALTATSGQTAISG